MGLKKQSVQSLKQNQSEPAQSCEALIGQLSHQDPHMRHRAAQELMGSKEALPVMLSAIETETDGAVIEALFSAVAPLCSDDIASSLIEFLKSENAQVRNAAIALFQQHPVLFARHVIELLCDADADTRIFAVDIIGTIQHPDARQWLHQVISSDRNVNVVGGAIDKLREIGDASSIDVLTAARNRFADNAYICFAIDDVSAHIKGAANE